jgi:hypothetical protein
MRVGGRRHTLGARIPASHLVAWYTFDKSAPVDETGNGFHFTSPVVSGPPLFGAASLAVNGTVPLEAPVQLDGAFTLAFWLFLKEDSVGSFRTVVGKGASIDELTPTVLLQPTSRVLDARISTDDGSVSVTSRGAIPLRRWTHVAVTCSGGVLRLFLNGLPEAEQVVNSPVSANEGMFRVGKDPWRSGSSMYLDDLRLYDVALPEEEVVALAPAHITGISSTSVRLGCLSCDRAAAVTSCEPARLCSLVELYAEGFHTARIQGWAHSTDEFWYHNQEDLSGAAERLAICC